MLRDDQGHDEQARVGRRACGFLPHGHLASPATCMVATRRAGGNPLAINLGKSANGRINCDKTGPEVPSTISKEMGTKLARFRSPSGFDLGLGDLNRW